MPRASNIWKEMPPTLRTGIIVGGAFSLYKIGKWLLSTNLSGGNTNQLPPGPISDLTYPKHQYKIFADAMETAAWGSVFSAWEDDAAMAKILMQMNTTADMIALNNAYGSRASWELFGNGYNLTQTLQLYLDQSYKDEVNEYFSSNGIEWYVI